MDVTMPQLGETVTEGTITKWFKAVGESVAVDEPLFEVSTDKVDSEVPAPQAGVLTQILVPEGETVVVGTVLATLGEPGSAVATPTTDVARPVDAEVSPSAPMPTAETARAVPPIPQPPVPQAPVGPSHDQATAPVVSQTTVVTSSSSAAIVASPLVRRLVSEYGLDVGSITGTGLGGRVTREDVLAAARMRGSGAPDALVAPGAPVPAASAPQLLSPSAPASASGASVAASVPASGDVIVPFENIRRRTAEHMVRSKATSAHVYTSVEVDFERIERVRRTYGAQFKADEGFSLTYLPFVARALSDVLRDYPHVNASVDGDALIVHREMHLGIAVDLDFDGLVAPVIRNVDGKRLRLIAREVRDLASRAKTKQLRPDEVMGGTFTITNMGPFGTLMTLPIINQPQVAILATDGVHKKPVVVTDRDGEDSIAIHHVGVLALAWDHRAFDGAYAASFLSDVKDVLERHDWESELA